MMEGAKFHTFNFIVLHLRPLLLAVSRDISNPTWFVGAHFLLAPSFWPA
jgi:hypothetical protein